MVIKRMLARIFENVVTFTLLSNLKTNKYFVPISSMRGIAVDRIFNKKLHVDGKKFFRVWFVFFLNASKGPLNCGKVSTSYL